MAKLLDPFRFLVICLAGRLSQRHLQAMDYLRVEIRGAGDERKGRCSRLDGPESAWTILAMCHRLIGGNPDSEWLRVLPLEELRLE